MSKYFITSESVTEGHPDKICDQSSDAILDLVLEKDPFGRVAVETLATRGLIFVAGELSTNCYVEIDNIVRALLYEIGYNDSDMGIDAHSCAIISAIQEQSKDIAIGVDIGGAGDQGMMYGFACNETPELMPLPIMLAHKLVRRLAELRKANIVDYLHPDGKAQVTVEYADKKPVAISTVILSAQHHNDVSNEQLHADLKKLVIKELLPQNLINDRTKLLINPTGRFVVGGPQGDTGVTGRKIIVDTYGGVGHHGGGCFSGKDPTKVDRSASYMARYVAKNIVAAGVCDRVEIALSYAIGVAEPISIDINSFGTAKVDESKIVNALRKLFDFTPQGIIDKLNLRRPIYKRTACYGHFGREEEGFSWEICDMADAIRRETGI
ncbi:methionine adenosyltransferase [candidate division WOR-3 bacterium RBG_13_43_14]|uniref:S-adenosylmethionine synthase n=1 Tax=candidate division WOR-3 bacterium RBG_13_43_14 TaxID=1802590 RepID=A0A1F4UAV3_UNCW3|nr:MAG: methionine adenosyltransferase [candidate division WOR-3 bacterium RBG_13_43_14]